MTAHKGTPLKKKEKNKRQAKEKKIKKKIPKCPEHLKEDGYIYTDDGNQLLGSLVLTKGKNRAGRSWQTIARVEAYCLKEKSNDILWYRLRHIDGDREDWDPAAVEAKRRDYLTTRIAVPVLPTPRHAHDRNSDWDLFYSALEKKEYTNVHFAYSKNDLQAATNVERGVLCIALCHSLVRNASGVRAKEGDVLVTFVSSSVEHGIRYRGVVKCIAVLEQKGDLAHHHNILGRNTSIFQVVGDEWFHRTDGAMYHIDDANMERDKKGVAWYSGCYAQVPSFRGIQATRLPFPENTKDAIMNHPIAKPKIKVPTTAIRPLIEAFRAYEKTNATNLTIEELEARN